MYIEITRIPSTEHPNLTRVYEGKYFKVRDFWDGKRSIIRVGGCITLIGNEYIVNENN